MFDIENLSAGYGQAQVLRGLSLAIAPGEAVAMLGRNGAGKSTLLKCAIGLLKPSAGRITFDGRDITGLEPHIIARLGIGYVPEDRRIFSELSVAENLEAARRPPAAGQEAWTVARIVRLFPNLGALMDRPGRRISGGEQQMLALARALMGNPRLMLLDEPSEGLAPKVVGDLARVLGDLRGHGIAMLLSEQNLGFAARAASRAVVVETGRIRWQGSMAELAQAGSVGQEFLKV